MALPDAHLINAAARSLLQETMHMEFCGINGLYQELTGVGNSDLLICQEI
jgi:hypothetical protein